MDCGHNAATDQARWSPGVNVGKPLELSDNCYLIQHGSQLLLWDTGYPDAVADKPVDRPDRNSDALQEARRSARRARRQARDITWVAVSHTHGDHVGNVDMFPKTTAADPEGRVRLGLRRRQAAPFKKDRPIRSSSGDLDIFGDGSVVILSTPGHTPGHQSLLVQPEEDRLMWC